MDRFARQVAMLGVLLTLPALAYAQEGAIAGIVRDASDAVLPGVVVEVASPALIEKVRSTITDGRRAVPHHRPADRHLYRHVLAGLVQQRAPRGYRAHRPASRRPSTRRMTVGNITETVTVVSASPTVDVQNGPSGDGVHRRRPQGPADLAQRLEHDAPGARHHDADRRPERRRRHLRRRRRRLVLAERLRLQRAHLGARHRRPASGPHPRGRHGAEHGQQPDHRAPAADTSPTSPTSRKCRSTCPARSASPRPAAPRSTSCRGPAATATPATTAPPIRATRWFDANNETNTSVTVVEPRAVSTTTSPAPSAARSSGTSCGSTRSRRSQGKEQIGGGGSIYPNLNAGEVGSELPAGPQPGGADLQEPAGATSTPVSRGRPRRRTSSTSSGTSRTPVRTPATAPSRRTGRRNRSGRCTRSRIASCRSRGPIRTRTDCSSRAASTSSMQRYNFTSKIDYDNPQEIPNIQEIRRYRRAATRWRRGSIRRPAASSGRSSRARIYSRQPSTTTTTTGHALSASYVTGAHNAKIGWDGQYYSADAERRRQRAAHACTPTRRPARRATTRPTRRRPRAATPALHYANDPFNQTRRPVPTSVEINVGDRNYDERVWTQLVLRPGPVDDAAG